MDLPALDLFCGGAGGWSLGWHAAGFRTVAACEIDPNRRAAFTHNNPGVVMYDDVRALTADRLVRDLGYLPRAIIGSPPCQDASTANPSGKGIDGERTGLFREYIRLVDEIRPCWVGAENVAGFRTRGADWVLDALEALDYSCWPVVVGAVHAGAPHLRKRVWFIAADTTQVGRGKAAQRRGSNCARRRPEVGGHVAHDLDAHRIAEPDMPIDGEVGGPLGLSVGLSDYLTFLEAKTQAGADSGFEPVWMPDFLFDFQAAMVTWSLRKGRAALFEDCGLGKGLQELVWAENVVRKTGGNVLLKAPLAVSAQLAREAEKFGIEAHVSRDGKVRRGINIANYERLHLFDPADFAGTANDESSILKNFDGARRGQITEFDRRLRYRLLGTATAAPNDYIELGTSSEALGYLGHMDMLNRFFKNDLNNSSIGRGYMGSANRWRFKGHAEQPFWRWVCSWARAIRNPSDLGFDDDAFALPPLYEVEHLVESEVLGDGMLFALPAAGLQEEREERRRTLSQRCEKSASLVCDTGEPAVVWCDLNDEGDLLERLIPGAVQVSGKDSDDAKEEKLLGFSDGQFRVLVTKQKIAGFGMNWQHCHHMTDFPSHSYEGYYQKVRRFLRFGQQHAVRVDMVTTEGGRGALRNMQRKAAQADVMFTRLVEEMNEAMSVQRMQAFTTTPELPAWL